MKLGCVLAVCLAGSCWAGTFGKVVPFGGQAADLALDEERGVLYVANFTANRIEVIRTSDLELRPSLNVAARPSSLALSGDGRYLVITHFGNFTPPKSSNNLLTVIDLATGGRQTFALGAPPLGVAFGSDGLALVATTTNFLVFDPATGATVGRATVEDLTANTLPAPPANAPTQIVAASLASSADGRWIFGLTDTIRFSYDVQHGLLRSLGYTAEPPLGPRVVSVSRDGAFHLAGWSLFDLQGTWYAQFPRASGQLHVGSHAIDSARGLIYAQIPDRAATVDPLDPAAEPVAAPVAPPVLLVADLDNLAVRDRLSLAENLAGKSVLSSDGSMMYSISDSGITAFPVGALDRERRITASHEDVLFRGSYCDRRPATQEITLTDPSGGRTGFILSVSHSGIRVSPDAGTTPAKVRITVDPSAFQNQYGTVAASIEIASSDAVNLPPPIRVLINNREPDQRGTIVNVPGKLVDILADPVRDRYYVLRQDRNEALVFNGANNARIATLRTGNTPTQMAFTLDKRYLLVGNDNSQIANVYDLDTLKQVAPIRFPSGHYPRSLAASGGAILAAVRSALSDVHKIDRVDFRSRTAVELETLGPWENNVNIDTMLVASGNGASILAAQADGSVLLYDASADTFIEWRLDSSSLQGAYAASPDGRFLVGSRLLNRALVPLSTLGSAEGAASGFAFVDDWAIRTASQGDSNPGVIERIEFSPTISLRPTRMAEAPSSPGTGAPFTRTLAVLSNRNAIVSIGPSGLTVLPWTYEAAVASPRIERVVNAADYTRAVASGGLIAVFGHDLSPVNAATSEMPLPTALAESCLMANGLPVPMLFVSPNQINAQLPYYLEGAVTLALRTPGGPSDNFTISLAPSAPGVFLTTLDGSNELFPIVVRTSNNLVATYANPIHRGDEIVIYAAGLGRTSPEVEAGTAAPSDPPAITAFAPEVDLGGERLEVLFSGLAPGMAGVYVIHARVSGWTPRGMEVPLTIRQAGAATTIHMRVVE